MRFIVMLGITAGCSLPVEPELEPSPHATEPSSLLAPRLAQDTAAPSLAAAVTINELMASNRAAYGIGLERSFPDWIELHNAGSTSVALDGWTVSDAIGDRGAPLDGLQVPPGGFLLLFADDDPAAGRDHLPFKLSSEGEEIVLRSPTSRVVDHVIFGPQEADVSACRRVDGDEAAGWTYRVGGTPGRSNLN